MSGRQALKSSTLAVQSHMRPGTSPHLALGHVQYTEQRGATAMQNFPAQLQLFTSKARGRNAPARRERFPPQIEALEERLVPWFAPSQMAHAYGLDQLSFNN